MICLAVSYVIQAGHEEEAAAHMRAMVEPARNEPGCLMYLAHRSTRDPRKMFFYEQYADQAAFEAHRSTPHFQEHIANGLSKIVESRTAEIYELI